MGLPTWDKPSFACLASRFPYGDMITPEALQMVGQAEEYLRRLGFRQIRVRHHRDTARIEVEPVEIGRLLDRELQRQVVARLKELGYKYVALDLEGYRSDIKAHEIDLLSMQIFSCGHRLQWQPGARLQREDTFPHFYGLARDSGNSQKRHYEVFKGQKS